MIFFPAGHPIIDLSKFNPADYPIDDEDERMRRQRAKEIAEGVELAQSLQTGLTLQENPYKVHSQVRVRKKVGANHLASGVGI